MRPGVCDSVCDSRCVFDNVPHSASCWPQPPGGEGHASALLIMSTDGGMLELVERNKL